MTTIENAVLDDIPQLCELLTLLFQQETDFQPDVEKQCRGLSWIIERPEVGSIIVLREGPIVLGMVNVLYTVSTACGGRVAIVEDMVVRPGSRNRGLGSLMIRRAIEFAGSAGCLRITLLTDRTNDSAIRFYQRHGFAPSGMIPFRLLLKQ
ncbi:MAG: N-acetyltransferase family protein [Desulfomonilaceae bacterium]|nr:GNAT family N-acetyltransferase [Syntrophaceae bacterium]